MCLEPLIQLVCRSWKRAGLFCWTNRWILEASPGGRDEELKGLFREIDENYKKRRRPTEREILASIQSYREEKRRE